MAGLRTYLPFSRSFLPFFPGRKVVPLPLAVPSSCLVSDPFHLLPPVLLPNFSHCFLHIPSLSHQPLTYRPLTFAGLDRTRRTSPRLPSSRQAACATSEHVDLQIVLRQLPSVESQAGTQYFLLVKPDATSPDQMSLLPTVGTKLLIQPQVEVLRGRRVRTEDDYQAEDDADQSTDAQP